MFKGVRAIEQERQGKWKTEESAAEEGGGKNLLIYRGKAECDLPALRI